MDRSGSPDGYARRRSRWEVYLTIAETQDVQMSTFQVGDRRICGVRAAADDVGAGVVVR